MYSINKNTVYVVHILYTLIYNIDYTSMCTYSSVSKINLETGRLHVDQQQFTSGIFWAYILGMQAYLSFAFCTNLFIYFIIAGIPQL